MYEDIIAGLKPYVDKGFIDSVRAVDSIGPDAIAVVSGASTVLVNVGKDRIEANFGDNRAAVLSGISPNLATKFIIQALGRTDFKVPVSLVAQFKTNPFPYQFSDAVIGPVGVTPGNRTGVFHAVYKDARGKFYIHEEDTRVSLLMYQDLYKRGSESEMLKLPRLFSSDTAPILTRAYHLVSEKTAEAALRQIPILSFLDCAIEGIPVRISSAVLPSAGYMNFGRGDIAVSPLGQALYNMALNWETTLTGRIHQAETPKFTQVKAEIGNVIEASKRAQVVCTFTVPTAAGLVTEQRSFVTSGQQALDFVAKFGSTGISTDQALMAEVIKASKVDEVAAIPQTFKAVKSSLHASVSEATEKSFMIKSSASDKPVPAKQFLTEAAIPEWLSGASAFSVFEVE